jgi:DNA-directed RNA polymerase sigma subunit (sigma70/sigma32)
MAIPRLGGDVKRGTLALWSLREGDFGPRRKIGVMGALRDQHDDESRAGVTDGDAAAMRELIRQVQRDNPLTAREESALLERSARGDKASQERLVAAHLDMVLRLAEAHDEQRLSMADLVQEGSIGLVEAVRTFATSALSDFAPFAEQLINLRMDDAIAAEATAVRDAELLVAAATDYERTELVLRRELNRDPTESERAEKLEWTIERTRYVAQVVADARRRYDEEMLQFIDPAAIDFDADEPTAFDS